MRNEWLHRPEGINVASAFNGMGCIWIALDRLGIKVNKRFSIEIHNPSNKVNNDNYPDTIQLGDITKLDLSELPPIDLVVGGSPCQGFSMAGKKLNFGDPRSSLFFKFVELVEFLKPKYFLLENVVMDSHIEDAISELMGVDSILLDSRLVSAQIRKRLYWTNIEGVGEPKDRGITWESIKEPFDWSTISPYDENLIYQSANVTREGHRFNLFNELGDMGFEGFEPSPKVFGGVESIVSRPSTISGRKLGEDGKRHDYDPDVDYVQCLEVSNSNKMGCLTTVAKDNVVSRLPVGRYPNAYTKLTKNAHWRPLSVRECEMLQTVPTGYTSCVSDHAALKMLGNGWTVDMIVHILSHMIGEIKQHQETKFHGLF